MTSELPVQLSGKYKGSFAYLTIKDRLPIIVTKIVDHMCREKISICKEYGEDSKEEIKQVVGALSQLKNFMQTNKPINISYFDYDNSDDVQVWKKVCVSYEAMYGQPPRWFEASWLFVECCMYKMIHLIFQKRKLLQNYDPFFHQKESSFKSSLASIRKISHEVISAIESPLETNLNSKSKSFMFYLIQMSLWGNQCDLSISAGADNVYESSTLASQSDQENILVDNTEYCWNFMCSKSNQDNCFALILDNAGFELFTDLCLLTAMMESGLCKTVDIFPKSRPWFVSDTMKKDIEWLLNFLNDDQKTCNELIKLWRHYFQVGKWKIMEHSFWTTPIDFPSMSKEEPLLYQQLSEYDLVIFKGDLNYRKLVGDLDWATNTPLETALQGFLPTSLLIMRTIKGGPVVGLDDQTEKVKKAKSQNDWYTSGKYGMIQFVSCL